jgi:hypothetical protein
MRSFRGRRDVPIVVCMGLGPRNHLGEAMNQTFRTMLIALAIVSPPAFAAPSDLAGNPAPSFSNGDPARWYQPLETPRQRYDNAMLEARNALAEALRECRQSASGRAACETTARDEYAEEVSQAKALLAAARQTG